MADRIYRSQPIRKETPISRIILMLLSVIIMVFMTVIIVYLFKNTGYQPPQHEKMAKSGTPVPEESYIYSAVKSEYGYKFYLAANLYQQEDGSLNIYFTNYKSNTELLVVEITDRETGDVMYVSGFLYPGEYVETLIPDGKFENADTSVTVNVYAFERDTFESKGTTFLNMELHGW